MGSILEMMRAALTFDIPRLSANSRTENVSMRIELRMKRVYLVAFLFTLSMEQTNQAIVELRKGIAKLL